MAKMDERGQNNTATVTAAEPTGAVLTVRGRPRASLFTSDWGEKRHAREIEKQFLDGLDAVLATT